MQHLWSAATWELQLNEAALDESTIGVPVTILELDVPEKRKASRLPASAQKVPLYRDLYLLTAWYVHDFLDKLHITLTDPGGREIWYNEPRPRLKGISTRAIHAVPIGDLWYSTDGLYKFAFYFSNDEGRRSESGYFKIVLNSARRP